MVDPPQTPMSSIATVEHAIDRSHLVPLPRDAAGVHALLALEQHRQLVLHLCRTAHAQLVEGVLERVAAPDVQPGRGGGGSMGIMVQVRP